MKQAKVLSRAEISRIVAVIEAGNHPDRNKTAFHCTQLAGMRVKEVAALKVGNVYDDDGYVRSQLNLSASQTKGTKSRTVMLNKRLRKALSSYYTQLPSHDPDFPLIYSQKSFGHFSANALCQVFSRIYAAAGIRGASSHSGRRTFITTLASKGVNARVLMALAGHKHLSTTQRYIDVNDDMLKQAAELI